MSKIIKIVCTAVGSSTEGSFTVYYDTSASPTLVVGVNGCGVSLNNVTAQQLLSGVTLVAPDNVQTIYVYNNSGVCIGRYTSITAPGISPTPTPTVTITPTVTPTTSKTPSVTPTTSATPSVTATVTPTVTPTNSVTPSLTPTVTPTNSVTPSTTPSITPTNSVTPTVTPSITVSNSVTPSVTPSISITPTTTPTVTPTRSPAPTPSPSLPALTAFTDTNGYANATLACRNGFGNVTKYLSPAFPTPTVGQFVYNDINLTTPYNGGSNYHWMTISPTIYAVQISLTGEITDVVDCSTIPSTTPSATSTVTPTVTPSITPTITPTTTPTVTPTRSPAPTPSPSLPALTAFTDTTGYANATLACRNGFGNSTKYLSPAFAVPTVGEFVYNDINLTTPYNGGSDYHWMTISPTIYAVRISLTGEITDVVDCSTIPSVTPSVTPTVTPSITVSNSVTPSVTPSITVSPSITPTVTPSITTSNSVTPTITPTTTPTITPTRTPAPTPSPSAAAQQAFTDTTGYANATLACRNGFGNSSKYLSPAFPTPTVGQFVYNDAGLTTPYNGGSTYHWMTISPTIWAVQIGASGEIIDVVDCSTIPSVTPSITPTPTVTPSTSIIPITLSVSAGCAGGANTGTIYAFNFSGGTSSYVYIAISSTSPTDALNRLDNTFTRNDLGAGIDYTYFSLSNGTYYVAISDSAGNKGVSSGNTVFCIDPSPSPTRTPSVTPTRTPAPTPSPSAAAQQFLLDTNGYANATLACRNGSGNSSKYMAPAYTVPTVGQFVYNDTGLSSPYNGGSTYHLMVKNATQWGVQIGGTGQITAVVDCSTIPSNTPSNSLTPTPSLTPSLTPTPTVTPSQSCIPNYSNAIGTLYVCNVPGGGVNSYTVYQNTNGCWTGNQFFANGTSYATNPSNSAPDTTQNWQQNGANYCSGVDLYQPQIQINPCAVNYNGTRDQLIEANSNTCAEVYVLSNCLDSSTGYSIVYVKNTFNVNDRVTSSGVTYVITSKAGTNLAGSLALTSTGQTGCPEFTQFLDTCNSIYYYVNATGLSGFYISDEAPGGCLQVVGVTATPTGTEIINYIPAPGCECV